MGYGVEWRYGNRNGQWRPARGTEPCAGFCCVVTAVTGTLSTKHAVGINVYLTLLEHVKDRVKKEELLELLGTTYFKGGFLQRSKDVFLRILKFSPRNDQALTYLLLIYEKLKDFKNAKEVTVSLEELEKRFQEAGQAEQKPTVQLRADKESKYDTVAQVMSRASEAGLSDIAFVSEN